MAIVAMPTVPLSAWCGQLTLLADQRSGMAIAAERNAMPAVAPRSLSDLGSSAAADGNRSIFPFVLVKLSPLFATIERKSVLDSRAPRDDALSPTGSWTNGT